MTMPPKYGPLGSLGLLAFVLSADIGPPSLRKNGSTTLYYYLCPFHDDINPSLNIFIGRDSIERFKCHGCGVFGNVFDYLKRRFSDLSFQEALAALDIDLNDLPAPTEPRGPRGPRFGTPSRQWQQTKTRIVEDAQRRLQSKRGRWFRNYLYKRGLSRDSTRFLGVDDGQITIPAYHNKTLVRVNRRRFNITPKYKLDKGSVAGFLFPSEELDPSIPVLLCEGEFDALLLQQESEGLDVQVSTLGSASAPISPSAHSELLFVPRILVCGDNDDAGQIFANRLCGTFRHAQQVILPSRKDPTDFHKAGHSIRKWIKRCLDNS